MEDKKYFHEASQQEVNTLLDTQWADIGKKYKQPEWCGYPEALSGVMGCWSLCDITEGGLRTKISKSFCASCPECIPQP